jgi:hypothetical protein
VAAAQDARRLAPLDPNSYDNLGQVYLDWNHPAQALAAFRQAERLSHQNPKYLDREVLALTQAHELGPAIALGLTARQWDNKYWYTHYVLAKALHQAHNRAGARYEAGQALFWEPLTWPTPPADQLAELRKIQSTG